MIVRCSACLSKFDDEFRSTVCSHEPFPANDGTNNFVIHHEAVLIPPRTIPPEKVLKHLQILLSFATGIGIGFNLRSLRWVIEQRTDVAAEEEIRLAFGMVAEDAMKRWPHLFQDFEKKDTGDGLFAYVPKYSKI